MEDELVTIAVFDSHLGIIAARDALRDEAIECFVPQMLGDKDTRQKHVTYPGILHESLQLQVGRPDVDRATAVLRQADLLGELGIHLCEFSFDGSKEAVGQSFGEF